MTDDDKRKQWQSVDTQAYASSDPAQVSAPNAANTQANEPDAQAALRDKFGTGFIGGDQIGEGAPWWQQFKPITSGSLYDPTAENAPSNLPASQGGQPVLNPVNSMPDNYPGQDDGTGQLKPFARMRNALGYRGVSY